MHAPPTRMAARNTGNERMRRTRSELIARGLERFETAEFIAGIESLVYRLRSAPSPKWECAQSQLALRGFRCASRVARSNQNETKVPSPHRVALGNLQVGLQFSRR